VGQLEHLLTKQAANVAQESYANFISGLKYKPNVAHAVSAGLAGLGLWALLRDSKRKRRESNWAETLEELANTPLGELRGELAERAKNLGSLSVADLALALGGGAI
jgi:hypothetical protein